MINKRLIAAVGESKRYIAANVLLQWIALAANIAMMGAIALLLQSLHEGGLRRSTLAHTAAAAVLALGGAMGAASPAPG